MIQTRIRNLIALRDETQAAEEERTAEDAENNQDTLYKITQRIYKEAISDADMDHNDGLQLAQLTSDWLEAQYQAWTQVIASNKFTEAASKQGWKQFLLKIETEKISCRNLTDTRQR